MDIKGIKPGNLFSLPALKFKPRKIPFGKIHFQMFASEKTKVLSIKERKIGRFNERILKLDNGQSVLVSKREHVTVPRGVDSSLLISKVKRSWCFHTQLKKYRSKTKSLQSRKKFSQQIFSSWENKIHFRSEKKDANNKITQVGLRPPQVGALHAIGAHWSIESTPATIIMPTGTGKTETMLASMISFMKARVLVVVPTVALREQTVEKFKTLGLLRELGVVEVGAGNPIVGELTKRPKREDDLKFFEECNVIVTNIANIAQGTAAPLGSEIAKYFEYLIIDEAHHIPAISWDEFKNNFTACKILQFTATPFRRDRKSVDGKVIFNYPLGMAQKDGYFNEIEFHPILGIDTITSDQLIADQAVKVLQEDLSKDLDHLVMARCSTIARAKKVLKIYETSAAKYKPVLITSETSKTDRKRLINQLYNRTSKILICVDMFGEGFDFPNLKIAAIHDPHKSLAIMLQFTGRFTRTAKKVGMAKVVADVSNTGFMDSLDELYSEDADWNQLLSEFSSDAIKSHMQLVDFLSKCQKVDTGQNEIESPISPNVLQPKFSIVAYNAEKFQPNHFYKAISNSQIVKWAWITKDKKTLFFVTVQDPKVRWSRSRQVRNREWEFFVLHYDTSKKLMYLNSSDTSSIHQDLASEVTSETARVVSGDTAFRVLGKIKRLSFQKVGLKRPGRKNISYSSFSGIDVGAAINEALKSTSAKSDIAGIGYENGSPVSVGCSMKGRVWSREQGSIQGLIRWASSAGSKLQDDTIDTSKILENTMVPTPISKLPDKEILRIDWPIELLTKNEINVKFTATERQDMSNYELRFATKSKSANSVNFTVNNDDHVTKYKFQIRGENDYLITHISGPELSIEIGTKSRPLQDYLGDYPPSILFVDGSELDGGLLYELKNRQEVHFPYQQIKAWDWKNTDIKKESKWKNNKERKDSIQYKVIDHFSQENFDIIFDDDGSGEAADVVCIKENADYIKLILLHCKYSSGSSPGSRAKDVTEVCSQAAKSNRWIWRFDRLCEHLSRRDSAQKKKIKRSRFERGTTSKLNRLKKTSRFKPVNAEIIVVQPGINKQKISDAQADILTAAHSYLLETANVPLGVISS